MLAGALASLHRVASDALGVDLLPVWNHRGGDGDFAEQHAVDLPAHDPASDEPAFVGREQRLRYDVHPRSRGQDPLLFLDFRAGRRRVRDRARGGTVLNLFAYTCGVGVAALAGGAEQVLNVDFAASALQVGERNARLNHLHGMRFQTLCEDAIPVLRQLSGLGVKGRARQRQYTRLEPRRFDLVVLDPPPFAKSAFGAVDVVRDYQSLFKPALLCAAPGGRLLATNNVASVDWEPWVDALRRCATKAGRPLADLERALPDEDFPSPDGRPPLKMAWITPAD